MSAPDTTQAAYVAESAQLYGKVRLEGGVSIWHNAVLRAECQEIEVGPMTNLQDFVMVHVGYDHPTRIGAFCSITHHSTVHGCTIEDHCLIGINACIMDGAVIGKGSIVAGGAMVTEGKVFPPGAIIAGVPAKVIGERDASRENRMNAWLYYRNALHTKRGDFRGWTGPDFAKWRAEKQAEVDADADL